MVEKNLSSTLDIKNLLEEDRKSWLSKNGNRCFSFNVTLEKAYKDDDGRMHVVGVASDTLIDRAGDRMTREAINRMAEQLTRENIDLLDNHRSTFGFGFSDQAQAVDTTIEEGEFKGQQVTELIVDFVLKEGYPQAQDLFKEVSEGLVTKQMSIGGTLNTNNPNAIDFKVEDGRRVRLLNDVILDHIATTRKDKAAVPRTRFISAIIKDIFGLQEQTEDEGVQTFARDQTISEKIAEGLQKTPVPHKFYPAVIEDFWAWDNNEGDALLAIGGWPLYRDAHAWFRPFSFDNTTAPTDRMDYFFPHHVVRDGEVVTHWPGVAFAMAAVLSPEGSRFIPKADRPTVYKHLAAHYFEAGFEPPDFKETGLEELLMHHEDQGLNLCTKSAFENYLKGVEKGNRDFHLRVEKTVVRFKSFPLVEEDNWGWTTKEQNEILGEDGNWHLYRDAHTWYDPDAGSGNPPQAKVAYKLPHHVIRDDGLSTHWPGVAFAMAALLGARGGVDVPEGDRQRIWNHLAGHYAEFDKEAPELKSWEPEEFVKFHNEQGIDFSIEDLTNDINMGFSNQGDHVMGLKNKSTESGNESTAVEEKEDVVAEQDSGEPTEAIQEENQTEGQDEDPDEETMKDAQKGIGFLASLGRLFNGSKTEKSEEEEEAPEELTPGLETLKSAIDGLSRTDITKSNHAAAARMHGSLRDFLAREGVEHVNEQTEKQSPVEIDTDALVQAVVDRVSKELENNKSVIKADVVESFNTVLKGFGDELAKGLVKTVEAIHSRIDKTHESLANQLKGQDSRLQNIERVSGARQTMTQETESSQTDEETLKELEEVAGTVHKSANVGDKALPSGHNPYRGIFDNVVQVARSRFPEAKRK